MDELDAGEEDPGEDALRCDRNYSEICAKPWPGSRSDVRVAVHARRLDVCLCGFKLDSR